MIASVAALEDDRDTVGALSQDSCSTLSLFSNDESDADGDGLADAVRALSLDGVRPTALQPTAITPQRASTPCDEKCTRVTLPLQWVVQYPEDAHAAHGAFRRQRASAPCTASAASSSTSTYRSALLYAHYDVPSEGSGCARPSRHSHAPVLSLPVTRGLFTQSFSSRMSVAAAVTSSAAAEEVGLPVNVAEAVAPTIARQHAELSVYLHRHRSGSTDAGPSCTPYIATSNSFLDSPRSLSGGSSCAVKSVDVTDFSGGTTVNGVPLYRQHRYHFNACSSVARGDAERQRSFGPARVASIGVGTYAALTVYSPSTGEHSFDSAEFSTEPVFVPHNGARGPSPEARDVQLPAVPAARSGKVRRGPAAAHALEPVSVESSSTRDVTVVSATSARQTPIGHADRRPLSRQTAADALPPSGLEDDEAALHPTLQRRRKTACAPSAAPRKRLRQETRTGGRSSPEVSLAPSVQSFISSTTTSECSASASAPFTDWTDTDVESGTVARVSEGRAGGRQTAARQSGAYEASSVRGTVHSAKAPSAGRQLCVYTTGMRLSSADERLCKELKVVLNPDLRKAQQADILVVQRPLVRSVKLLTVLPHVRAIVQHNWLDTVLERRDVSVPLDAYAYTERRTATSIEAENKCSLSELLSIPPDRRCALLSSRTFWVHRGAQPQDPPLNDLKSVITGSGGSLMKSIRGADFAVLPSRQVLQSTVKELEKQLRCAPWASTVCFIVPDDLFRAVLQQRPPHESTVTWPAPALSQRASRRSSAADATKSAVRLSSTLARKSARAARGSTGSAPTPSRSQLHRGGGPRGPRPV